MIKKLDRFIKVTRICAWVAGCVLTLASIFFPIIMIFIAMAEGGWIIFAFLLVCFVYLVLYFLSFLFIKIYPYWNSRKRFVKILSVTIVVVLVAAITAISIIIPNKNNHTKLTTHFQENWGINIIDNSRLKYKKQGSCGFVDGLDKLTYAVFKMDKESTRKMKGVARNKIYTNNRVFENHIARLKRDFPDRADKEYAHLYFDNIINDFEFKIPERHKPNFNDEHILWELKCGSVKNGDNVLSEACIFIVYNPNKQELILFEYILSDD